MEPTRPGLSALAGRIIGYRRNGLPIRLAAGGSEPSEGTDGADGTGADSPAGETGQDDATNKPEIKGEYDPDRAMRDLGKARDDAKREKELRLKTEQDQQAKLDAVQVALGLKPDPKTDPAATAAKVAKELTDAQARIGELTIENALFKLAGKAGADVDALTDSRTFMKQLAALDPSATDFDKAVGQAIRDAVKSNPKLALGGQGPARQGADHNGGTGARQRPTGLGAAIAARMNGN
ncbi:hypothetical protein [Salinispora arenicola]|uniref:hypothetical protein n=1 Tax=Salinispora arenicola TaxID=168697 RepID=UPI00168FC856|nr:hypothetical protein [Salinispora arenicola]NIL56719.1 hypothetical protein [Salinispora arenicola]NIL64315.1 hypothetical protein [Salinispora arenicola]